MSLEVASYPVNKTQEAEDILNIGQVILPEGIIISENQRGTCLIAGKNFKKDQPIAHNFKSLKVPTDTDKIKMTINGMEYICDKTNTILYNTYRQFPLYNSYLNHHCDPNTLFVENNQTGMQDWKALRDIKQGEEITCNYLYFYYHGDKQEEFQCSCGAQYCYKQIKGFKYLSLDDKMKFIHILYEQTKALWLRDDQNIVLIEDLHIPQSLQLNFTDQNNFGLTSKSNLKKGDIAFKYTALQIKKDSIVIFKDGQQYKKLNVQSFNPEKKQQKQFEYLKNFTKHSFNPNIEIVQNGMEKFAVCLQDIKIGDQLTLDLFKNQDKEENDISDLLCFQMGEKFQEISMGNVFKLRYKICDA